MDENLNQASSSVSATQKIRIRESVEAGLFARLHCSRDGHILRVDSTLANWLGVVDPADLINQPVNSIIQDDALLQFWLKSNSTTFARFELFPKNGRKLVVKAEVRAPTKIGGSIRILMTPEISDALIQRTAYLEALLTLTAGTIHDVNNVLTVLSGNLFLLTEDLRGQDRLCEQARRARNTAKRGNTLLQELLDANRLQDDVAKTINPGNHAVALEPLLSRAIGPDNELTVSVGKRAGSVVASAAQFESVLINLVMNARDALPESGRINVEIRDMRVDRERSVSLGIAEGVYVLIEVIDNGTGIPHDILERVTQPLFTTKIRGQGSGLGLSMVRKFAEQNQGCLQISSIEGQGTVVSIWLPRTVDLAETTANMTLPLSTLPGGTARILLVARDPEVRSSIQQILETLGYTILSASDAGEANRLLANSDRRPAVVICERSAKNLADEQRWINALRAHHTGLLHIALLQAGANESTHAPDADGYLFRPFTVPDLAWTVRGVLKE